MPPVPPSRGVGGKNFAYTYRMETTATIAARIRQQIESGRLQEAHAAVDVALENSPAAGRPVLLCVKSYCLVNLGHTLEGLRVATEAHEGAKASEASYPAVQCEALLALGFALQALEEHARAIGVLTDAESLAKETGDTALHGQALRRLGISCSVLGRHLQALEILESAVAAISENGSLPDRYHARFSVLNAKCRALEADGNITPDRQDQFRALYRQWLTFIDEVAAHGLTRLEAMSLGNSGIAARHAGDYTIAYDTLTRAGARYARMGLRRGEATSQNHLGAALVALNRPEEAVAAFIRGIALLEGDSPRELRDAWEELAAAYEAIDEPRLALAAFKKARDFKRELHDDDARVAVARREQREEIARLSLQWSRLADEDTLTGVANRRAFDRALARAVDGAKAEIGRASCRERVCLAV